MWYIAIISSNVVDSHDGSNVVDNNGGSNQLSNTMPVTNDDFYDNASSMTLYRLS